MTAAAAPLPRDAVAYLRASTEDQKLGPEAQRATIEAYATKEGIRVIAWHLDQGISGAAPIEERPALTLAIAEARLHRASLIVAKRDRLARDAMIAAMIDRSLSKGASVISADGSGNGTGPADAFMRTVLDGASEYERALIRARTKAALQAKRARGERAGAIPFGFTANDRGLLAPNEAEQTTIARILQLRKEGHSHRAIVATLLSEGTSGRTGNPLGLAQVQRILTNASAPTP